MAKIKKFIFGLALLYIPYLLINGQIFFPAISAPEIASGLAAVQSAESATTISAENAVTKNSNSKHIVTTTLESIFKADDATIWNILTDFQKYPNIFKRIKSVEITKHDGNCVYVESHLQPQFFVKRIVQHMVNDLSAGPKMLKWRMIDGNFKYLIGKWELQQRSPGTCLVKYTLDVDLGPIVPAGLINFVVHHMQQEIVADLKHYVEAEYSKKQDNSKVAALIR
jgi:ribosome-associated toxin RatA of RatAB toxin-antitoxin module